MEIYNEENQLSIIIADDHEIVRAGIRRLFIIEKSIKIVGEAANGRDAIEAAIYHKPQVVLLDILMPVLTGIEATPLIKKNCPDTMVVMLTAFEDAVHLEQALAAGADGYLSKDIGAKDLIAAIHRVALGDRVFSKSIINLMQKKFVDSNNTPTPISITKREQEILDMVAMGKTSVQIADKLNISVRTVESHRYNLMQKLGVTNAAGLVRYSMTHFSGTEELEAEASE